MLYVLVHDLLDEENAAWGECEMEMEPEDPVSVPAMPDLRVSAPDLDDDIPF